MQRMYNISKWKRLDEGQSLHFDGDRPRVVRIEVNSRDLVGLYLFEALTGKTVFLSASQGRDTIEFHCGGAFSLVSDGEAFIYTADGEFIHHEAVDPVIFTRITERRQINPEILAIQRMMNLNIERRLAAQRDEFNAILRGFAARSAPSVSAAAASDESGSDGVSLGVPTEAAGRVAGNARSASRAGGQKRSEGTASDTGRRDDEA